MLIGTHRLLSKDVIFKELGLLIIDEEQRFGVEHKEKLKHLKANIDVLTLSATPIPRTLQMSMVGIRSLSLLETPPQNRYPIQTYVIEEHNQVIKEAIEREVARGGQVFVLHNRVSDIVTKTNKIRKLVKGVSVEFAHGQMSKTELNEKMQAFIEGEFNVLVSTTIIETGIDIPNANTLIILDADKFGLSQLYQLRGRVGRSNKVAYAYLMFQPKKVLTTIARKRLGVIKDFTELGSGFKIAMRDLSIRGAGDILGGEQAGFIETVGIELYTKMLEDTIKVKKGMKSESEIDQSLRSMANVSTHIPTNYILDDEIRIQVHKEIRGIKSVEDLDALKSSLKDKYGKIPNEVIEYINKNLFDFYANKIGIKKVVEKRNYTTLEISKESSRNIEGEKFLKCATATSRFIRFLKVRDEVHIVIDTVKDGNFIEVSNRFLTSYFN
jgi:transcription-repair coupling factor (superfamily II helicase)